jgi:hypothetical protein
MAKAETSRLSAVSLPRFCLLFLLAEARVVVVQVSVALKKFAGEQRPFRHSMLDPARVPAKELGHPGAPFPWRTISGILGLPIQSI